jgi:hypothetical protein
LTGALGLDHDDGALRAGHIPPAGAGRPLLVHPPSRVGAIVIAHLRQSLAGSAGNLQAVINGAMDIALTASELCFHPGQRIVSRTRWITVSRNILPVLGVVDKLTKGAGD